jgi:hypothetical protein
MEKANRSEHKYERDATKSHKVLGDTLILRNPNELMLSEFF